MFFSFVGLKWRHKLRPIVSSWLMRARVVGCVSLSTSPLFEPVVDPLELLVEEDDVTVKFPDFATELRNAHWRLYVAFPRVPHWSRDRFEGRRMQGLPRVI